MSEHSGSYCTELERPKREKARIEKQLKADMERRQASLERGAAITGLAELERKKRAKQLRWDKKWAHRRWKIEAKKRYWDA